jgi:hypothetical protein
MGLTRDLTVFHAAQGLQDHVGESLSHRRDAQSEITAMFGKFSAACV